MVYPTSKLPIVFKFPNTYETFRDALSFYTCDKIVYHRQDPAFPIIRPMRWKLELSLGFAKSLDSTLHDTKFTSNGIGQRFCKWSFQNWFVDENSPCPCPRQKTSHCMFQSYVPQLILELNITPEKGGVAMEDGGGGSRPLLELRKMKACKAIIQSIRFRNSPFNE